MLLMCRQQFVELATLTRGSLVFYYFLLYMYKVGSITKGCHCWPYSFKTNLISITKLNNLKKLINDLIMISFDIKSILFKYNSLCKK